MFKRSSNYYKFEKNNKFADRVLVLSLPSAMVFIMLVALRLLAPSMAVISYATIILFNVVFLPAKAVLSFQKKTPRKSWKR